MNIALLLTIAALQAVTTVILLVVLLRKTTVDPGPIKHFFESIEKAFERVEAAVKTEISNFRGDLSRDLKQSREELSGTVNSFGQTLTQQHGTFRQEIFNQLSKMSQSQNEQLLSFEGKLIQLRESNDNTISELKLSVEGKLKEIQSGNETKLEEMRKTVDEKLQGTLERRLGESFKLVSERLEQVSKGLGEMQSLANGVGDLKKVLTNVKTRGTWGEVQLEMMLEQVLAPEQYEKNVSTTGTGERVEFAIKLPGRNGDRSEFVWLPVDAKFPAEDYQRIIDARERADKEGAEAAVRSLASEVERCAKAISTKYIAPPFTTDFGILYLPVEGLFAEVISNAGLVEKVKNTYHVMIAGPTTLWAILNSLLMGFRTLAIQERTSEVWKLLGAVKTEWSKYDKTLELVQKKLSEASSSIDKVQVRTRAIDRHLRKVEELPSPDAKSILTEIRDDVSEEPAEETEQV
ncbi:MAG TPA: DNA recombination protein RmuC [Chitinispirillaceae bacterium]|jgi:DNA recombination protein RmuC|nr:DNA recombination protein RmuC [Chitinispirillaceae bacterium]